MYYKSEIKVTVRVPPNRFGEPLPNVILELARQKYESSISPEIGMVVALIEVKKIGVGKLIAGDGGTFHEVDFLAITYKPEAGEILEGEVAECIKFGVFLRVGCTDALCHVSQIGDDKFALSTKNRAMLVGKETHRTLEVGDRVRARTIKASVDHVSMKIAVSMKGQRLGPARWRKEDQEKNN
jgi:DNA-directed RNA polymerase subunit E'